MKAQDFLEVAGDTMNQRGKDYDKETDGAEERSMGKTIEAFNTITGRDLKESEGWLIMVLLKQVRQHSSPSYHADSALDSVAYAALLAESLDAEGSSITSAEAVADAAYAEVYRQAALDIHNHGCSEAQSVAHG